jgi:hypothetical protein
MLFVLYQYFGTKIMPAQTYQNLQTLVKCHHKSVAQCKAEKIKEHLILFDSDDRLEVLFEVVRCLVSGMRNMDMSLDEERFTIALQVSGVYTRHPEWYRGSRRLPKEWK